MLAWYLIQPGESPRREGRSLTEEMLEGGCRYLVWEANLVLYLWESDAQRELGTIVSLSVSKITTGRSRPNLNIASHVDYVEGMWRKCCSSHPPWDFVLATGETHRVAHFVEKSFSTNSEIENHVGY